MGWAGVPMAARWPCTLSSTVVLPLTTTPGSTVSVTPGATVTSPVSWCGLSAAHQVSSALIVPLCGPGVQVATGACTTAQAENSEVTKLVVPT